MVKRGGFPAPLPESRSLWASNVNVLDLSETLSLRTALTIAGRGGDQEGLRQELLQLLLILLLLLLDMLGHTSTISQHCRQKQSNTRSASDTRQTSRRQTLAQALRAHVYNHVVKNPRTPGAAIQSTMTIIQLVI